MLLRLPCCRREPGYSYLRRDPHSLYSFTRFRLVDGSVFTNVFRLKLHGDRVVDCRHGERPWVDLRMHPVDHYPASAYPLLLPKAVDELRMEQNRLSLRDVGVEAV